MTHSTFNQTKESQKSRSKVSSPGKGSAKKSQPPPSEPKKGRGRPSTSTPVQRPTTNKKQTVKSPARKTPLGKETYRPRKYRPGTRSLMEIRSEQISWKSIIFIVTGKHICRKFQKSTNLLIPKLPFSRVLREICYNVSTLIATLIITDIYLVRSAMGGTSGSSQRPSWHCRRLPRPTW